MIVGTYLGLEQDFAGWVPAFGSAHSSEFPLLFLNGISRADSSGDLIQVNLTYSGASQTTLKTGSGLLYANLQTETQLVTKSFSWEGVASISSAVKKVGFSAQYSTFEATFTYTAFNYPNAGQFQDNATILCALDNPYWNLTTAPLDAGVYSGYPTIPTTINPNLTLQRFSAKQLATSTYSGSASTGSVASSRGPWNITETWALDYNLGSLGIPIQPYTF